MTEEWRAVIGYEGSYEVSNKGRVKSLSRVVAVKDHRIQRKISEKILSRRVAKTGRSKGRNIVVLSKNALRENITVSALVLTTFVGVRPVYHEACHVDGDNTNDSIENLYWGTHLANMRDRDRHGKTIRGTDVHCAKLTEVEVKEIRKSASSHASLARQYFVAPATIWSIRNGKKWRHVK